MPWEDFKWQVGEEGLKRADTIRLLCSKTLFGYKEKNNLEAGRMMWTDQRSNVVNVSKTMELGPGEGKGEGQRFERYFGEAGDHQDLCNLLRELMYVHKPITCRS